MATDLAALEEELASRQREASDLRQQIAEYYDLLLQEFWKDFPELAYCEGIGFPWQQLNALMRAQQAED